MRKIISLSLIFILVFSIFSIIQIPQEVEAEEKVCCSTTNTGEFCQYTSPENCAEGSLQVNVNCEQTSFCKTGCCYDQNEGRCYKNTPKATCNANGGSWKDSPDCAIPQCERGCCQLSNECAFITPTRCKKETSQYENVTMRFDANIKTELECTNQCRSAEQGACVSSDASCKFATRSECSSQTGNETSIVGFHPDMLCSNPILNTNCAKQQYTGCLPDKDEVYWFDSCGNKENIYSSDKRASYNNGYVLSKEQSCSVSSPNDQNCGNCNYAAGTLCGKASSSERMPYGDFTCKKLSCDTTFKNQASPSSGSAKKSGEAWCVYDTAVGFGRDTVGSRHYRHICINGEELTEECKDFREEMCIQGVSGQPPFELAEAFSAQGSYIEAACRTNRWKDCQTCNSLATCTSGECSKYTGDERKLCCRRACCDNIALRDCHWLEAGLTDVSSEITSIQTGSCIPHVPPGFTFWTSTTSTKDISSQYNAEKTQREGAVAAPATTTALTSTTQGSGDAECGKASQKCNVEWEIGGVDKLTGKKSWKCIKNCHCLNKDWLVAANTMCKSAGDCGAYYNVLGKSTLGGLTYDIQEDSGLGIPRMELTSADVGDWTTLVRASEDQKSKYSLSAFWGKTWPVLTILAGEYAYVWTIKGIGREAARQAVGPLSGTRFGRFGAEGSPLVARTTEAGKAAWESLQKVQIDSEQTTKSFIEAIEKHYETLKSANIELPKVKDPIENIAKLKETSNSALQKEGLSNEIKTTIKQEQEKISQTFKSYSDKQIELTQAQANWEAAQSPTITIMEWINTIMWIYTIYNLVDLLLKDTKTKELTITCQPWQAPLGGEDCEKCNSMDTPCSEYKCRSLGQLCQIVNPGTKQERCVNMHPNDVTSPIISPMPESLQKGQTIKETTEAGNKGYTISPDVEPFTPVTLGIKLNEPSQCKFSAEHSIKYEQMPHNFGDSLYLYNHTLFFALPSELATEQALELTNNGQYSLYIKCQDASGNKNLKDYFIKFKIKKGPDFTPPVIELTSIQNNAYAPYNVTNTPLSIYTNEPSDCKWSNLDKDYTDMENNFICKSSGFDITSLYYGLYECSTLLSLNLDKSTNYYFRCKDRTGNLNEQSYKFSLQATKPLKITSSGPSGTLYTTNTTLKVSTTQGAENGKATCAFSLQDIDITNMIKFYKTGNLTLHEQPMEALNTGSHTYYIKCSDTAGNQDSAKIIFSLERDIAAPRLTQLYTEASILHLELNEITNCEYSTTAQFTYGQGTPMTGQNTKEHEAALDSNIYYVRCQDLYGNEAAYTIYP